MQGRRDRDKDFRGCVQGSKVCDRVNCTYTQETSGISFCLEGKKVREKKNVRIEKATRQGKTRSRLAGAVRSTQMKIKYTKLASWITEGRSFGGIERRRFPTENS